MDLRIQAYIHKSTASRRWIGERLGMENESRLCQAIRRMKDGREIVKQFKERLEK